MACVAAATIALAPGSLRGQDLAARVASVRDGAAHVSYALRAGAEICDRGIRFGENTISGRRGRGPGRCTTGPVTVELTVRDGAVRDVEVLELDQPGAPAATDLGEIDARAAATYLLSLARGGPDQPSVEDAVFAAALADVEELWGELLALARDRAVAADARESAIFWVGQDAADAATAGIAALAADEREEQDVREAAIFALSQRPAGESIPVLMEIARTAQEAETRESAMFWLAQSNDERVLAFFEEILLGRLPR